jgi:hypothetical protein
MKTDSHKKDVSSGNSIGVTIEQVYARATVLASQSGRALPDVLLGDYEQAKRELQNESKEDQQEALPDSIPSINPLPDSTGRQVPETPSEDEDNEGRSNSEQLIEEGAEQAKLDQIRQAARATDKSGQ